jgi:thioredoxin reductase (NADPH)
MKVIMGGNTTHDCLVIGGGPAGLTAALYLARFCRNVLLMDGGDSRAALIPESHNYPGFAHGVSGGKLLAQLREQATQYGATIADGRVETLARDGERFRATCGERTITAPMVILATGIVDEKPALPSLPEFIYRGGVRFCPVCDGYEAMDKRIAVAGPLRKAVKKALFLRAYSRNVVVLPFDREIALADEDRAALEKAGIPVPTEPLADLDTSGTIVKATMASGKTLDIDVLYPAMGAEVRSELAVGLGARHNEMGCLFVDEHMRTVVPNLYAIGDITLALDQISVATGQAAIAATHVHNTLPPNYR